MTGDETGVVNLTRGGCVTGAGQGLLDHGAESDVAEAEAAIERASA